MSVVHERAWARSTAVPRPYCKIARLYRIVRVLPACIAQFLGRQRLGCETN
jgi:hypothetical protein